MNKIIYPIICVFLLTTAHAAPIPNVWQPAAEKVCDQINQAVHLYKKNDLKNARSTALMSYFTGYDAEIEPAVRITLGGPHVFAVERKFRDFPTVMIANPDSEQMKKVAAYADELCRLVHDDAKALNAEHVPLQVFKVE